MSTFAPPDIFAAIALAARGDPDLTDGSHIRLMPSPALGFPIAPFGIFRVEPIETRPDVIWRNDKGQRFQTGSLDQAGGVLIGDIVPPPPAQDAFDVAVELVSDGPFRGRILLIDRVGNRVLSKRNRAPFIVGGPRVDRVRIEGQGAIVALRTWRIFASRILESLINARPLALLSLPIDGERPWYATGRGENAAMQSVRRGAPQRLQPPDRPDGPFDALTPDDEALRVAAHAPPILDACEQMLRDAATPPRDQRFQQSIVPDPGKPRHFIDLGIARSLLAQAMDPGIGRYLGLLGAFDDAADGRQPAAYAALGLFAYPPNATAPDGRSFASALGPPHPQMEQIATHFAGMAHATDLVRDIRAGRAPRPALDVRGLMAVAGAVPPPDPPALPTPTLGSARWLAGHGQPSQTFRQDFLVPAAPLGALIALGRRAGAKWTTRHDTIDLPAPADPAQRARAMLLGRTQSKPRRFKGSPALNSFMRRGLISDSPIPSESGTARYRFALADLFGRFGQPAELDVPVPERPAPPNPALQTRLVLDGPDGVGTGAASPGHVIVDTPVPSVTRLAAGSLDIVSLELAFDGVALPAIPVPEIAPDDVAMVSKRIDLPGLQPTQTHRGTIGATFIDRAGTRSPTTDISIAYADRRRPPVVATGLGLIWTSRPGPSPEVELKLTWPGHADCVYRVFIADEKSLGLTGASRADVAVEGGQRDRAGTLGGRGAFRLLTEPPLAAASGQVVLDERLPRSLATVQFLKVVPVTPDGREAAFESCPVVPVAVPTDRGPPPPRASARINSVSGKAVVTIEAVGLDLVELEAAEPGLFTTPPAADALAPEFRLRRASGLVPDPIYAREVARGNLAIRRDGGKVVFVAQVEDPTALLPFVRYSYWAEVRMPPERRLKRGVVEVPPAGGVTALSPAQIADMARPFSAASAPATVLRAPSESAELAGVAASVIAVPGSVRASLTAPATPAAPAKGIGPYKLRIWEQWGNGKIASAGADVELHGAALSWQGAADTEANHPRPATLRVAVIDPLGRQGPLLKFTAP
jgi:hypothetical protein